MEVESQEDCSSLDDWPYELLSESIPANTARSLIHSIDKVGKKPPPRPRRSKARQTVRIPRYRRIEASVEAHYSY
ncbi:unnamed protein product [Fusarium graminearum]|uniref:Chromosome 2, complete genome n=1 Tax=Gibberella zeae (strain ATCC MYA-4620 / CBS 123657 / FGSC 9075 / NRRL 31084 / PH-1) TaxID=229533 RepID=A0A1C3YM73_GIBZE|nr:unnamed protein product [Fusarium graminearum]